MGPYKSAPPLVLLATDEARPAQLVPGLTTVGAEVRHLSPDWAREPAIGAPDDLAAAEVLVLHLEEPEADDVASLVASLKARSSAPILALLGASTLRTRERVLEAGAADVVAGPCSERELRLRVARLLESRAAIRQLEHRARELELTVEKRDAELEDARVQILERLARAAEYRDDETGEHTRRVGALAAALAEGVGMPAEEVTLIERAAPLHDVGKIGVPDGILLKPGRLSQKEMEVMQAHTGIGARMLSGTDIRLLNLAATIAFTHHEHWDGNGYPEGMRGDDIPLPGRLVAVADVFDALTTKRPYKRAWPLEEAVAELEAQRGRHLDPDITDIALSLVLRDALPDPIREHVRTAGGWES